MPSKGWVERMFCIHYYVNFDELAQLDRAVKLPHKRESGMGNTYLILKSVHIFGVMLLMGNIIVTAWWKFMANKTKDPSVIAFAQRQVTLTDFVFTAPGALLAITAGDSMAYGFMSNTWDVQWLTWGRCLFIASGIIWITVLIPTQIKQARMARTFIANKSIPNEYWKLSKRWNIFGAIAVLLPLINIYWMVFKPK